MNTVTLLKSLSEHFTLPPLQVKESTKLHEFRWNGTFIEFDVFIEGMDDEYLYSREVDIQDFRAHCELTNEIDGSFCDWFEGLSWFDQQVEAESYADGWIAEIKADYAAWQANRKAI